MAAGGHLTASINMERVAAACKGSSTAAVFAVKGDAAGASRSGKPRHRYLRYRESFWPGSRLDSLLPAAQVHAIPVMSARDGPRSGKVLQATVAGRQSTSSRTLLDGA